MCERAKVCRLLFQLKIVGGISRKNSAIYIELVGKEHVVGSPAHWAIEPMCFLVCYWLFVRGGIRPERTTRESFGERRAMELFWEICVVFFTSSEGYYSLLLK